MTSFLGDVTAVSLSFLKGFSITPHLITKYLYAGV